MFGLAKWLVVLGVLALVIGGVVEIKLHPEQLLQVPARVQHVVTDPTIRETVLVQAVRGKRWAEQWILKDEAKQREVARQNVITDAKRLRDVGEKYGLSQPSAVVPQADLLRASITRVEKLEGATALIEVAQAADLKATLEAARTWVTALAKDTATREVVLGQLESLVTNLAAYTRGAVSSVAGVTDEAPSSPAPSPSTSVIPLSF